MAPRRRMLENRDLPTGLTVKKVRGQSRFRYRYPTGKDFYFPAGTKRHEAIQATLLFNMELRGDGQLSIDKADKYNKPLSYWIPIVIKRVRKEEKLGEDAWRQFNTDCKLLVDNFGKIHSKAVSLETVNDYLALAAAGKSNNVYNRKISFLRKVFNYLIDESAMLENFADRKKTKPKEEKERQRLKLEDFKTMLAAASADPELHWLYIAMRLSLQTTHATLEVSRIKYRDIKNGYLRIHRQKVKEKEASRVEIPVTAELQKVIDDSRNLVCPYVVHRVGRYVNKPGEGCDHPFQVSSKYISRGFSDLRDSLGICANLPKKARPTFHEIRALSIHLFDQAGVDPQSRAAHSDAKSTKIYKENHVEWVRVPAAEIKIS